jgi:hypothetical protein
MKMQAENKKGRMLTVWGGPGSGKTTLAAKLAARSEERGINTIVLLCDNVVPELPMLSDFEDADDARRSLGLLLDSAAPGGTREIYDSLFVNDDLSYVAFLGYTYGENPLSYPPPTKGQARAALSAVRDLCDAVIVSAPTAFCASALAMAAAAESDLSVCVASPGIKSLLYLSSNRPLYPDRTIRREREDAPDTDDPGHVTVFNHPDEGASAPDTSPADFLLPFSAELGVQGRERRLLEALRSRDGTAYQQTAAKIYERFMPEEEGAHER